MKYFIKFQIVLLMCFVLTSCLEGDDMNTPPGKTPFLLMTNIQGTNPLLVSGLRFFDKQALLLNPAEEADTVTFAVTLQGTKTINRDIHLTLATPETALDDYLASDQIHYQLLPSEGYTLLSTDGVIPAGQEYAEFQVVFHPNTIDLTKNYMLPITAINDAGLEMSSNYGHVYYHVIGNPIAGLYTQEWIRYNNAEGTGSPFRHTVSENAFAPSNGTTIKVNSGTGVTYILSFTSANGMLSNFKATFDEQSVTDADITIEDGPFVVEADPLNGKFELNFIYKNSDGDSRNITDIFTKK